MSQEKLEILFDAIKNTICTLRIQNPLYDGKGFWQPIKKNSKQYDGIEGLEWIKVHENLVYSVMSLPEYIINGYGVSIINEPNHFAIQQIRIPLNEKPTVRKILQIALNVGQYQATRKLEFVTRINPELNFNRITDFIPQDDIEKLSQVISGETFTFIMEYLELQYFKSNIP
jgi:hypothetical protein